MSRSKQPRRSREQRRTKLSFERLEQRLVLDGDFDFGTGLFVPDSAEEQIVADKAGTDLAWLYSDYVDWQASGEMEPFATFSPAMAQLSFAVQDLNVAIEAYANDEASSVQAALASLGFQELASYGRGLDGWLPIISIGSLPMVDGLNFARLAIGSATNVGLTDTQGDLAQVTNQVRNTFGVNGAGVTVGVISDSYNIAASASRNAAQDVASGDLPAGVNVLADATNPNAVTDEGRAMLQIVHDVAPGANLAFHWAGASQVAMANAIGNLRTAGSGIITDDVIFFAEPMFQDGIIAQAVNNAVTAGSAYFSSAGNQARRSYQSAFNAGQQVNIGGVLETAHEFDPVTDDILQRITVPIGGRFLLSFQWDAPFATAGGAGANNNLNIYLIQNGTTIVAQGRTNNIGGDAVEVPFFNNNTNGTQFDILITSAGGPIPGTIKYVDFGIGVTFNEYLTNSTTLFGHANAQSAIALGASSFLATPAFGVNPPVVENFSALGGTPIIFNAAGVRLATPVVRQKPDFVAPDGGNTTFFGTDIAGDADTFPNFFGTSAAAPHAAGLAALMLDAAPSLTPTQIWQLLRFTTIDMDDPVLAGFQTGFDFATGTGLINGIAAMTATRISQGDYNANGSVDAADYVVWRNMQGNNVANFASPDGSGNGNVGSEDYTVWRSHFGQAFPVPGAGSGSSVSESTLAEASQEPQESAAPLAVDENLMVETTAVATADFTAFDLNLFQATIAPTGRVAVPTAFIRHGHGALVGNAVTQDQGLLAWLSASSSKQPTGGSNSADDGDDFVADNADRYWDGTDSALETLVPFTGATTKLLTSIG